MLEMTSTVGFFFFSRFARVVYPCFLYILSAMIPLCCEPLGGAPGRRGCGRGAGSAGTRSYCGTIASNVRKPLRALELECLPGNPVALSAVRQQAGGPGRRFHPSVMHQIPNPGRGGHYGGLNAAWKP